MQPHLHTGLDRQLEEHTLQALVVERRDRVAKVDRVRHVTGGETEALQPLDDLLRDAPHHLEIARVEPHDGGDHRRGEGAAEEAVALDERYLRSGACRRHRRNRSRGTAPGDDDVVGVAHRRTTPASTSTDWMNSVLA